MEHSSDTFLKHAQAILEANQEKSAIRLRSICNMGINIYFLHFEEISSTMILSQNWDPALLPQNSIIVFIARKQSKGKGQNTNTWHSPTGNIYLTLLTKQPITIIPQLIPTISVCIAETLEETLELSETVQIKWVNDMLVGGKKISGILIKSDGYDDKIVLQIGIGINVNQSFNNQTTSLREYCLGIKVGGAVDLDQNQPVSSVYKHKQKIDQDTIECIIDRLCIKILLYLSDLKKSNANTTVIEKYNERLIWKNEKVIIYDNTLQKVLNIGVFKGINQYCFALLREDDGSIVTVSDGRMRKF